MATRNSRYFVTPVVLQADGSAAPQRRYHYLDVAPASGVPQKATMLLLHGFPDFHVSWSHILAPLSMSGFRLIVPDCLGCGLTSKPSFATRLDEYGVESMTEDLIALLDHAKAGQGALYGGETVDANGHGGKVVCVGHDWGAALAWALARRRADRLLGVASLAVPYTAPSSKVMDMKTLIKRLPNFGYQAFFADPKSTKIIEANLERFLGFVFQAPGLFSNDTKDDPHAPIANTEWVLEGRLEKLLTSPKQPAPAGGKLLSDEELANRVRVFQSGGMEGPLNWYRKRAIDATSDAKLTSKGLPATLPCLFIQPDLDAALPAAMAKGMQDLVPSLRTVVVRNCGHWVQIEAPSTVETEIRHWFEEEVVKQAQASQGVVGWIRSKM